MSAFKLCGKEAAKELSALVKAMTPEQREGFQQLVDHHRRWYYTAGHKLLGRKLNDYGGSEVKTLMPHSPEVRTIIGNGGNRKGETQ